MTAGPPLIEVRGLRVDYGAGEGALTAVRDADLTLRRGQIVGLAGESGSGKSTLAFAMTRLLRAPGVITGGQALLYRGDGPPLDLIRATEPELQALRWSQIAVVMQSAMHALNPVLTIAAQLTDVLAAHRPQLRRRDRLDRAGELLGLVGIPAGRLTSYPHQLSGGMRQRVMIAMALALEPAVVIMDEPTTALDVVTQREILTELAILQRRLDFGVLFITHDLSLLVELADEIAVMYASQLVEHADAASIYYSPRHPYTSGLLHSFPPLHGPRQRLTGIPGSPPDLRSVPAGCPFQPRCPHAMTICAEQVPPVISLPPEGGRSVACWLHARTGAGAVPPELDRPEPAAIGSAANGSGEAR